MLRSIALCLLLTGCAHVGVAMPRDERDDVEAAWKDAGYWSAKCEHVVRDVRVVVVDDTREKCGADVQSCMLGTEVIVLGRDFNVRGNRVHELLHALGFCTLMGPDPAHVNQVIWGRPEGHGTQAAGDDPSMYPDGIHPNTATHVLIEADARPTYNAA